MNQEVLISLFLFFLSIVWEVYNLKKLKKSNHILNAVPLSAKTWFKSQFVSNTCLIIAILILRQSLLISLSEGILVAIFASIMQKTITHLVLKKC